MQLRCRQSSSSGFTLVEMMIAMAIGLVVVGSVLGLVMANLQSSTTVGRGIRLTQESRALTEILSKELQRAGFDGSGITRIGSGTTATTFTGVTIVAGPACPGGGTNCCIQYGYDENGNGGIDTLEFRSFSRDVTSTGRGVVRFGRFDTAAAVDCTSGRIITSDDISVGDFRFRRATTGTTGITSASDDACFIPKPVPAVTLPSIPVGDIYFAMNLSLPLDRNSTSSRRTDGVITLR